MEGYITQQDSNVSQANKTELHPAQTGRFIEGLVSGVLELPFIDIRSCLKDFTTVSADLIIAIDDFNKKNFEGIRQGLG